MKTTFAALTFASFLLLSPASDAKTKTPSARWSCIAGGGGCFAVKDGKPVLPGHVVHKGPAFTFWSKGLYSAFTTMVLCREMSAYVHGGACRAEAATVVIAKSEGR